MESLAEVKPCAPLDFRLLPCRTAQDTVCCVKPLSPLRFETIALGIKSCTSCRAGDLVRCLRYSMCKALDSIPDTTQGKTKAKPKIITPRPLKIKNNNNNKKRKKTNTQVTCTRLGKSLNCYKPPLSYLQNYGYYSHFSAL